MAAVNDPREPGAGEAGYTLVLFVMVIAIMSIMMGVAVQSVSFQRQREKEAELIFRGGQYVEAIRLYKTRYGRNPMRLKEIWEADPKVIRRKFKDPITDSENWGIVFVGQEGQSSTGAGGGANLQPTGTPTFEMDRRQGSSGNDPNTGLPPGVQRDENGELMGPIAGVHSTSCDQSIRVYEGRTTYCEWRFIYRDDQRRGGGRQIGGGGRGGQGGGRGGQGGGTSGGGRSPRGGGYHGGDKPGDRSEEDRQRTPGPRRTGTPRF